MSGCATRAAKDTDPNFKTYTLHAEQSWQMNLPEGKRFDASGLLLTKSGELLTESDRGAGVYRIKFLDKSNAVDVNQIPDCFTAQQLAPYAKEKFGRYDVEGLAQDEQGRIYLCEEANRWILRWDEAKKTVERLNIDWSSVSNYFSNDRNASFEGIAIHGQTLYVANERKKGRLITVDLNTLKVTGDFVARATHSIWSDTHYSDLSWFDGALYALLREDHVVLKIDPTTHKVMAEYDFNKMENAPDVLYLNKLPVGVMEGLAVDKDYFWLCTDNNGHARKKFPNDIRPTLFRCPRPDR